MKIKKGDNVQVIAGKDKGKKGKVLSAFPRAELVIVDGVNIKKRHKKPTKTNQKGQIIEKMLPVHVSNVMIIDPKTNKPTRIGFTIVGEQKTRIARKSKASLDT